MVGRSTRGAKRPDAPRVALWGRFDLPLFGDLLHPRILEAEISRRLPGARVSTWSPFGSRRPLTIDGGLASAPLGIWSRARIAELAASAGCVVIGGGEVGVARDGTIASPYGLEPGEAASRGMTKFFLESVGGEPGCALAWNAVSVPLPFSRNEALRVRRALTAVLYVSVPDRVSKRHLEEAGVETEVVLVPDPLLLASRLFTPELLGRRLEYLRRLECFPAEGAPVLVDVASLRSGDRRLLGLLAETLGERHVPVVLLDTQPPDETRGEGGPGEIPGLPVFRIPAYATLADLVAALANSACVLTSSRGTALAASAFGTPCGLLAPSRKGTDDIFREPEYAWLGIENVSPGAPETLYRLLDRGRLDGLPREVEARLEGHFARLAAVASSAAAERGGKTRAAAPDDPDAESRAGSWRQAYEALATQAAEQRLRLAERFEEVAAENASRMADVGRLQKDLSSTIGVNDLLRADLEWSRGENHRKFESIQALEENVAASQRLLDTRTRERDEAVAEVVSRLVDVERLRSELSSTAGVIELLREELESARGETKRKVDTIHVLESQLADRRSAKKAAEEDAARWRMESDDSLRKLTSAQDEALAATSRLAETEEQLEGAKAEADRLRDESSHLEEALEEARAELTRVTNLPLFWFVRRLLASEPRRRP